MTRWAAPLALTRGLLVGLCVCWPSYTSAEGTERDPSQNQTQREDAVEANRLAAEQGDAGAQSNLGVMYESGRGVPQDETEAVRWFRLAAEQGFAQAQSNLGAMYETGRGVPQDETEAVRWFRLAAEQGHAAAQSNLGAMYETGRGVPQDETEAVRWYRLAAEQGHVAAQSNLGVMYRNGRGVPRDQTEAVRWYRLAADQGHVAAQYNLGVMYGRTAAASRRMRRRPCGGSGSPPTRGTPARSTTSGSSMRLAWACRRTTSLLTCGTTLPVRGLPAMSATFISGHGTASRHG